MVKEQIFRTVDIERRGFGKRYTWLPVDDLNREGFAIDCTGAYVRPHMYDIQPGDIARWREGERLIEGLVAHVQFEGEILRVDVTGAKPLPADAFYP